MVLQDFRSNTGAAKVLPPFPRIAQSPSNAWLALPNPDSTQIFHKSWIWRSRLSCPLTSCASSAVRCLWSRSHFGRMSVKLLADCAAGKGQCWRHSMSSSALQEAGLVSRGILLLTDSGSFLATPFRRASWRASASYSERRIRANDHALS
jgi:hypothetical protein